MNIRLWLDNWVCNESLKARFPLLFSLEKEKRRLVGERANGNGNWFYGNWKWSRPMSTWEEMEEWKGLLNVLEKVELTNSEDGWVWEGCNKKDLTVRMVKEMLAPNIGGGSGNNFVWSKWIPEKCNIFLWRASMNRIPTMSVLHVINCGNGDTDCVLCNNGNENVDHLFCACDFAMGFWNEIGKWVPNRCFTFEFKDFLDIHEHVGMEGRTKKAFKGIVMITCWNIWKAMNEKRFENKIVKPDAVVQSVKSLSFLWFKSRDKYKSIKWKDWCMFKIM